MKGVFTSAATIARLTLRAKMWIKFLSPVRQVSSVATLLTGRLLEAKPVFTVEQDIDVWFNG
jgi:hypothetical protein